MKKLLVVLLAMLIVGCANDESAPENEEAYEVSATQQDHAPLRPTAVAEVVNTNYDQIGEANFYQDSQGKTVVHTKVEGLKPEGFHGYHIHENGVCEVDAEEGPFMSAGGHFSLSDHDHGHHTGDLPSLYVNEDGTAQATFMLDQFTPEQLLENDVSLIIHEGRDNFANIPDRYQSSESDAPGADEETRSTGDSGDRIGCGVVVAPE
ncbi:MULTISPECIES: superoxide dismutase family protein [Geomicrobium]|uniref:Superoxide dismutase [Cu-Zn] n=1 Tax=Geomicrobium sediminis TaxID=1347788 RepID=A0ABS2PGJ7_9BACL|nr:MULTISPECIES: superoxide dismutase family protein [Geomicrobium]MBM7634575.1 Cu-Zn family superoxide dismutase [Geomicrobium sediminis]GAJ99746.1 superoxide dismutase [Cu-Zn] precursor [Geomicrobium sp. JCM 19055]GAK07326.1 superoxide dismutase [Cu-Zn] precursor [Geomicrobium sp. JCM 19038]